MLGHRGPAAPPQEARCSCCHRLQNRNDAPTFHPRAIQESLLTNMEGRCPGGLSESSRFDSDLQLAMELSAKELAEQELRLQEEEAELQQVLQLSLTEK